MIVWKKSSKYWLALYCLSSMRKRNRRSKKMSDAMSLIHRLMAYLSSSRLTRLTACVGYPVTPVSVFGGEESISSWHRGICLPLSSSPSPALFLQSSLPSHSLLPSAPPPPLLAFPFFCVMFLATHRRTSTSSSEVIPARHSLRLVLVLVAHTQ